MLLLIPDLPMSFYDYDMLFVSTKYEWIIPLVHMYCLLLLTNIGDPSFTSKQREKLLKIQKRRGGRKKEEAIYFTKRLAFWLHADKILSILDNPISYSSDPQVFLVLHIHFNFWIHWSHQSHSLLHRVFRVSLVLLVLVGGYNLILVC